MKFRKIFQFELAYQIRHISAWLYFIFLLGIAFMFIVANYIDDAIVGGYYVNTPIIIASASVFGCLIWLLLGASVAGDAGTRDIQTRMYPLTYTLPVKKTDYLVGRFLAAFFINALIMLALPLGILIAVYLNRHDTEVVGPFNADAYLNSYFFILLPNAFIGSAIQFSMATLKGKAVASYLASIILFLLAYIVGSAISGPMEMKELGTLVDPMSFGYILDQITAELTPIERNTRIIELEGSLLRNRLLWIGIALCSLVYTCFRFRFAHPIVGTRRSLKNKVRIAMSEVPTNTGNIGNVPITIPQVHRSFGFTTFVRQTRAIAWTSFQQLAKIKGGLAILILIVLGIVLLVPIQLKFMGIPMLPKTDHIITLLTAPLSDAKTPWIIIPLLIMYYAGELVWREREARMSDIAAAAPVPEWSLFLGKYLGLTLILVLWLTVLTISGLLAQISMGVKNLEIGLYLQILFGLQLPDYLLFAMLALVVHVVVNQKYVGYLITLLAYGYITFGSSLGVEHKLLIYGADTGWSYSEMRGYGSSIGPWLWFKSYWVAWAFLLAVFGRLLWVRGREKGFLERLQLARQRFTRPTAVIAISALMFIFVLGGFIFYNTNVINDYQTAADKNQRSAEYEKKYGRYKGIPQPEIVGTKLHVEIYPHQQKADIRGTYFLVNISTSPIDSIHLATASEVETNNVTFNRAATLALTDQKLGHRIYILPEPLEPGDSVEIKFTLHYKPQGFKNSGKDEFVVANGTYFKNLYWFPFIGYQSNREINAASVRKAYGLTPRPENPSLYDTSAYGSRPNGDRIKFEAEVGTSADQIAIAPGTLVKSWKNKNRRYFHYASDVPMINEYAFFSAKYAVYKSTWNNVAIQIYHHPGHKENLQRMMLSAKESLEYYSKKFGPYPYNYLRFIERPGQGIGMHADAATIDYSERSSGFNPDKDSRGFDFVFAVVAHEVAHQWWGHQLIPAYVEGSPLLSEGLAWYSAMGVVEAVYGKEYQRRFINFMLDTYEIPSTGIADPLLSANGWFLAYRKGPLVMYSLGEYIGKEKVDKLLKQFLKEHQPGKSPLATSLDLYQELRAVTPDSMRSMLHDFFVTNTFWDLKTESAVAKQLGDSSWQVTIDVDAGKIVVDTLGTETMAPMNDWIEVGVFPPVDGFGMLGKPLYLQKHRVRSGKQKITILVRQKPARAGIDPHHLLIDQEMRNNVKKIRFQ